MVETFKNRDQAKAWQHAHADQVPLVGQPAPDFELRDPQGQNPLRLSSFAGGKPVALVFGSAT
ncbi:MAG: redoxin domain-containing protein [Candidatus Latescibacteria bacterium]|nr:redoxin domain-containing protein [Candidatus Latescibacterota bacterium]